MTVTPRKREWVEVTVPGHSGMAHARFEVLDTGVNGAQSRVVPCVVLSVPPDRDDREIWIELDDLYHLIELTNKRDREVRRPRPVA